MKRTIFLLSALIFLFASCNSTSPENKAVSPSISKHFSQSCVEKVNAMSLREKIGQVLLVNFRYVKLNEAKANFDSVTDFDYNGTLVKVVPLNTINPTVKEAITKYKIGNVILFAENFIDTEKAVKMISDLQRTSIEAKNLPLIISVDQEGGRVNRIFQTVVFPPAKTIGHTGDVELAREEGKLLGMQLKAFGINLDFAPVADVDSNPKNPVIGDRSFSSDPKTAARFAEALQEGLKSEKVIPCAKHFPGHGDTETDSHLGLPLITKSKKEWASCEAVPFKKLISKNIPVIMSAHIQYPALDSSVIKASKTGKKITRPATLSKVILTDILRNELGYKGVICTDALDMKAISENFSESQAVIEALNAGADLICNPVIIISKQDLSNLENLYRDIEKAILNGTLSIDRLNEAVLRIVQLKNDYGILEKEYSAYKSKDFFMTQNALKDPRFIKLKNKILAQ